MGITCEALDKEISVLKAGKMTWDTVKQLNLLLDLRAKLGDDAGHGERLTDDELRAWLQRMDNADGMNMMYSDYYSVGVKYGVDRPEFYADLAKAFLFDKDSPAPAEKLAEYYHEVVK